MPQPHETLSIFAEVSVALAGFSGIAIAFGRRSLGSLSRLEVRRLSNLFILSGLVLLSSLLMISLLHLDLASADILWRGGSAILFLMATPWLAWDVVRVTRLERSEKSEVNRLILYSFDSLAVAVLALQLVNLVYIIAPWPFFLALTLAVAGAFQQFILLVRMGIRDA